MSRPDLARLVNGEIGSFPFCVDLSLLRVVFDSTVLRRVVQAGVVGDDDALTRHRDIDAHMVASARLMVPL